MGAAEAKVVQLHLKINGEGAFNTLKDLNEHIAIAQNRMRKMSVDDPGYKAAAQKLRECIDKQKAWREEIYGTKKVAKSFFDDFKGGLSGIAAAVSVGTLVSSGIQSAIGAVSGFFSNAQASWVQGEQTQAQLAAAIKSTGGAAGRTRDQLNELSAALQKQTGINSDVIAQAEALLLTFTNIGGEVYDKTLPILLDMSKALGQDLKGASIQVGKAMNDPITGVSALAEVGVTFTAKQKTLIKSLVDTGDVASAQKIILNELATEFGGVAEAISKTGSGQLEAFNTRIEKIQESVGGFITGLKAGSLTALEPFVRLLEKATAIDLSAKLREEQADLNGLVRAISMTNTNQTVRNQLITDLQAQYPDFLGKIKQEDASNELLARRLKEVNAQYREKIFIAANEDRIKEIQEKRTSAIKEEAAARMRVAQYIGLSAEKLAKLNDKEIEALAIKKQNEALKNAGLGALAGGGTAILGEVINYATGKESATQAVLDAEKILHGRQKINESFKEESDLMAANAVISAKIKDARLKAIDEEIAKLNQLKDASEIARLTEEKKGLLGIATTKPTNNTTTVNRPTSSKGTSESEQVGKEALRNFEKFGEDYQKLQLSQLYDTLSANEKEIQAEKDKYANLITEREAFLTKKGIPKDQKTEVQGQISGLKDQGEAAVLAIQLKQEEERLTKIQELRDRFSEVHQSQLAKEVDLIKKSYAKLKQEAKGNAAAIKLLEVNQATDLADAKIREEERFQKEAKTLKNGALMAGLSSDEQEITAVHQKYDAQIEALKEKYSEELQLTQDFNDALAKIEASRKAEITAKTTQTEESKNKETKDAAVKVTEEIANATFSIMANNRHAESQLAIDAINSQREAELANKDLTEEQKKAINDKYNKQIATEKLKAWQADKAASLAQAVINGALAVVKAAPNPILMVVTAAAVAAQLAVIAAQNPPKFARGGQLPQGPTHANGGIALIAPNGQKVGEIEGGEPILSRETYANNRQLIDALLYSSQRLNGATIGINTREAIKADRMFRNGGLAPSVTHHTTHNVSNTATDLSVLVQKFDELKAAVKEEKARPVEFNYRVFEGVRDKIEGIRAGVEV